MLIVTIWCTICVYGNDAFNKGDVNSDQLVNAKDALVVLKHAAVIEPLAIEYLYRADVNKDSYVDANDALDILCLSAGIISSFDDLFATQVPTKEPVGCVAEVNYKNARVYNTSHSEPCKEVNIEILSNYTEYKTYIREAKEFLKNYKYYNEIDLYSEYFFNDNVVVVVDYCIGDYSTEVVFSDVEYIEGENRYQINVEHYGHCYQEPAPRHWGIMVPIEGKNHTLDEFYINKISNCEWYCRSYDCGKARPIRNDNGQVYLEYPLVLSTYEEYQEYMALFKAANPEYAINREYTEEDFESMKMVVGGFGTASGQLELKYSGIRTRDNELIIDFDGICPSPCNEDSYFYHFMVAIDIFDVSKYDIRWNIDVEYYYINME